ncbi:glycosyltransferase family 4 protein [Mediterraneibacter catenae]|uniref:Glycosyltransferase family 4 protein n=1 Tax=Mediterraneibacter catenae TaxID=2594882 RepID=A0A5M9HW67_9FIRM|nr:glycosyltransferase family 4 protein [Mediterraneibacter catenae]
MIKGDPVKKVLLTATVQSHIAQFHRPLAEVLHEHGYELHVAARNNLGEKNGLSLDFADKVFDVPFSRSPKSPDNVKAYFQLKKILAADTYDVVHCNTPMGGIVSRLAAVKARKQGTRVFYTAHGFHFYKGASKKNWLVFYPVEKIMAGFCDTLITITKEDRRLAGQKFHTNVEHIHGVGVYTERYHAVSDAEKLQMRSKEGLKDSDFVILCTGELNQNKNQKALIKAAAELKESIPGLKILLAGNGPLEQELRMQIRELGVEDAVRLLGYRTDLEKVTPAADLVVSCSYREGLPLNILEAMLCCKPVVASVNRGHRELVRTGYNGYLVPPDSPAKYAEAIKKIYSSRKLAEQLGENGFRMAQPYTAASVKKELSHIYQLD